MTKQQFKAVYFQDHTPGSKGLVLAFGAKNQNLYQKVAGLNSEEIRGNLGSNSYQELVERAKKEGLPLNTYCLWLLKKSLLPEDRPVKTAPPSRKPLSKFLDRIIEGDCLEVMKELPDKSIDMILCDLPYGTTQNHWDSVIPLKELWSNYERIIKDSGAIILTSQGPFTAELILSNTKLFKYKLVWVKSKATNFLNARKQPLRRHEDICIFCKGQTTYRPQMTPGEPYNKGVRKNQLTGSYGDFKAVEVKSEGERYPTDVIYFKTAESEGEVYHPTQKPVELARYLIRTYSNEGEVVLDNACGSGSFPVGAVLEERHFIGIELNQEHLLFKKHRVDSIEICNQRIKEAKAKMSLTARAQKT